MFTSRTYSFIAIGGALLGLSMSMVGANAGTISFTPAKVPITDPDKRRVQASPSVNINGAQTNIGFNTILRSGDRLGEQISGAWNDQIFGKLKDINGNDILQDDGTPKISSNNDFSSLINLGFGMLFMVSHFESRPGAIYLTKLNQDSDTGKLSAVKTRPLDLSKVRGGWVHCAGSVTPWNSHLGSEEYEPDARLFLDDLRLRYGSGDKGGRENTYKDDMADYFPARALEELNPYDYGWPIEVKVDAKGKTVVDKHYAMARMSLELAYVMPDERTVYMTDDGTNVGLFMFVADEPRNLEAGTLYAAEWKQKASNEEQEGRATLNWHNLGHAVSREVKGVLDLRIGFADLFETDHIDPAGGKCVSGQTSTNHGHDIGQPYVGHECLKLKVGEIAGVSIETIASRLESRRYAGMRGATTEFRKTEGITFDPDGGHLYLAVSEVSYGMLDNPTGTFDVGGPNHIRLPENKCGVVYSMTVKESMQDAQDNPINSAFVAKDIEGVVAGIPTTYPVESPFAGNTCDVEGIANPDNLTFIQGYDTLIIGEDSGSGHQNNMIWSYHIKSKELTRIQTSPYGSETTSVYYYPNINGWAYIMSVVQHPYDESDSDKYRIGSLADRAYTGYIGPFPAMD